MLLNESLALLAQHLEAISEGAMYHVKHPHCPLHAHAHPFENLQTDSTLSVDPLPDYCLSLLMQALPSKSQTRAHETYP